MTHQILSQQLQVPMIPVQVMQLSSDGSSMKILDIFYDCEALIKYDILKVSGVGYDICQRMAYHGGSE